ncbi:MAG: ATP-binding protein, partial [Bacteroidota bacterium]
IFDSNQVRYHKSFNIRDSLDLARGTCISLRNLGALERRQKNFDEASNHLRRGLILADSTNYKTLIASINYEIGMLYYDTGSLDTALIYLKNAKKLHENAQNYNGLIWSSLKCGQVFFDLKQYSKAYENAKQTYDLAIKINKAEAVAYSAILLSKYYAHLKDYETAYQYHLIYSEEKKQLINRVNIARTANYKFQLESDRERENLKQARREEQINFKYKQQQNAFIFAGCLLLTITMLLYINFLQKKRTNLELIGKNEELKVAREVAETAVATKQNFLATMSHEIRTPMNAVLGFTDLLLESKPQKDQLPYLKYLKFSGEQLFNLLNDILDYSRIDAKKIRIEPVDFNYKELVEEVVGIYKSVEQKNKDVEITLEIENPDANHMIHGDPTRLKQILTNLIDNAIKFTPKGNIIVKASAKIMAGDKILFTTTVKDTGIGISKKDQAMIFDSFTQKGMVSTRDYEGAGLGLSICKGLVEVQGGTIGVQSE